MTEPVGQAPGLFDQFVGGELDSGLALLSDLEAQGLDPMSLILDPAFDADQQQELGTRPEAPIPGETDSLRITLAKDAENLLALEQCDLLDEYERAMKNRNERDEEICDAYAQLPDEMRGGRGPESAQMVSEMTMSFVDQAHARIATGIMGITPLIRVDPVEAAGFEGEEAAAAARSAEQFLQSYCLDGPPDMRFTMPMALLRTCKVGTSVFYVEWVDQKRTRRFYPPEAPPVPGQPRQPVGPEVKVVREGQIKLHLLDNRDVKIWPPNVANWQDATFIAHEARHTPQSWRGIANRFGLATELREMIANNPSDNLEAHEQDQRRQGIETSSLLDRKDLQPVVLTEIWGKLILPGRDEPEAVQMILHRPTRKLLYLGYNPHFSEKLPYFPLRYKWSDDSAWGTGVGHECIYSQAADTSMWNLELDNLMAGAYYLILRRPGSMYNTQTDDLRPGAQLVVDDVNEDFRSVKVGGEAPELTSSRLNNYSRARTGTGLSSVASGQGDPVMKSGAGTGSVLALIEQGDKKLRMVDSNIRTDLSVLYVFFLELVAQYAPDGIFYKWVGEKDAANLKLLKFTPPRGSDMAQLFRLKAQAPSIGASDESRKERVMLIGNLAQQHIGVIDGLVSEQLTASNPAALPKWKETIIRYLTEIHLQTVRLNELPRLPEMVPTMPAMTPEDEQINTLNQEKAELQSQLEQVQQQLAELAAQGQAMVDQGGQPVDPNAPPQEMPMDQGMGMDPSQMDPSMMMADPAMAGMMGGGMPMEGDPNGMGA